MHWYHKLVIQHETRRRCLSWRPNRDCDLTDSTVKLLKCYTLVFHLPQASNPPSIRGDPHSLGLNCNKWKSHANCYMLHVIQPLFDVYMLVFIFVVFRMHFKVKHYHSKTTFFFFLLLCCLVYDVVFMLHGFSETLALCSFTCVFRV